MRWMLGIIVALAIGCAGGVGPNHSEGFRDLVASAFGVSPSQIERAQPGDWSDMYGYRDFFLNSRSDTVRRGILVQTAEFIGFAIWMSSQEYSAAWKVEYDDVTNVQVDKYGRARRIVINLRSGDFRTFSVNSGGMVDQRATREIADVIEERRPTD